MIRFFWFVCVTVFSAAIAVAQKPFIQKVEPLNTYTSEQLLISGSGFSSSKLNLQVWFGQVRGTIESASDFSITVTAPPQARLDNIDVVNLSSRLSGRSENKFMPSYSGTAFKASDFPSRVMVSSGTSRLYDICTCDFNNDGRPDIAASKDNTTATDLVIFRNSTTVGSIGPTSFDGLDRNSIPALSVNSPTQHIICGDLDNDGRADLVAVKGGNEPNRIYILRNTSTTSINFEAGTVLSMDDTDRAWRVMMSDLDGDGRKDLVVTNSRSGTTSNLYIFKNESSGNTISFAAPIKLKLFNSIESYGLDVQDFDGDGKPDIVATRLNSSGIHVLRNTSTTGISFNEIFFLNITGSLNSISSADVNNDGKLDLVVTSALNNQVLVLLNETIPGFIKFKTSPIVLTATNTPIGVDVSDINGDGFPDIAVANLNQAMTNIYLHSGNFTSPSFTRIDVPMSKASRSVRAGDLDGDGKPDLVFSSNVTTSPFTIEILRNANCHKPVLLNTPPLSICRSDQTIRLRTILSPGVTSYQWLRDGNLVGTTTTPFFDITGFSSAGSYSVRAVSEGGSCTSLSDPLLVNIGSDNVPDNPPLTSNAVNNQVCAGNTLILSTNAVAGASYVWSGPNNFSATTTTNSAPPINAVTQANAGLYTLQVKVGDCASTIISSLIEIVDFQSFSISSSSSSNAFCQGGSLILSVPAGYSYKWFRDNSPVGTNTNQLTVSQAGSYTVTVSNPANCESTTAPVQITTLLAPVASFDVLATACAFQELVFTGTSQVDNTVTPVYAWDFGDGKVSTDQNPKHTYTAAGIVNPKLTVRYQGVTGCENSASKSINVTSAQQPVIAAEPNVSSICPGEEINLSVIGDFTSFNWTPGGSTNASIAINQPGTYSVSTTSANGCSGKSERTFTSKTVPLIEITASQLNINLGQTTQLEVSGADTYEWTPAETLSDAKSARPVATPSQTTVYTATGKLTNSGCVSSASITITVVGVSISPPTAFSPNGDAINDRWIISGIENFPDCTMTIYDGRGRRIYQVSGYTSEGWDGTYEGKYVPAGTYYYVFNCPFEKAVTGNVLVIR